MKIRTIKEVENTSRDVNFTGGNSQRLILEEDNMGFSLLKTIVPKGGPHHWHYKNHKEACYCLSGKGILTDLKSGIKHIIEPETVYILDNHDDHTFEALTDVVLMSIFNPPLDGSESHDKDGVYNLGGQSKKRERAKLIVDVATKTNTKYDAIDIIQEMI